MLFSELKVLAAQQKDMRAATTSRLTGSTRRGGLEITQQRPPAPLQDKAQLHKISGGRKGRRYQDDEGILPDRPIEAACRWRLHQQS